MSNTKNCAIIGGSGTIATAMVQQIKNRYPAAYIHVFSSNTANIKNANSTLNITFYDIDYNDEESIKKCAQEASAQIPFDKVFVGVGMLHSDKLSPEKSLSQIDRNNFESIFSANTITPALLAKYFIPRLNKKSPSVFAALSARVGSVSDNRMGGWHAYRASKAALNMILKNAAIEISRSNKNAIIVGLHPGTVDSPLSKPFQRNVPEGKLFTPEFSASQLLSVMESLTPDDSGKCFAWDGKEIQP